MESVKTPEEPSAMTSPKFLQTPASLTSSLSSPMTFGAPLSKERSTERNGGKSNPRTPASLPFDNYSPIKSQRIPPSRSHSQTTGGIFTPRGLGTANQSPTHEPVDETARTNALWAEMRATLAEVEPPAVSSAQHTHFFGPQHAGALEELRTAQIALAQAWARADGDLYEEVVNDLAKDAAAADSVKGSGNVLQNEESSTIRPISKDRPRRRASSTNSTGSISPGASSSAAERDVASARLRREANDEYFYRVSQGVTDVVGKLEEVTKAMDRVERASRSVWSDDEDSVQEERADRTSSGDRDQQDKEKTK